MIKMHRWAALLLTATVAGACADSTAPAASVAASSASANMQIDNEPATIRIGYFSKSPVVAMAQAKGYFAEENLTIVENQTPSSPVIFRKLRDAEWDVILTQSDNVFNYRYNPSNPLGGTFDPVIFAGTDWGNGASLMARPEITTCADMRGKTVAVDSPNSGFAFVLYGILRNKCGLERNVDYTVIVTGGTPGRYADLLANRFDATILNSGYQFRAAAAGMNTLGNIADAASPFMGGAVVSTQTWLDAHSDAAIRFLRAMTRAQQYVLDPANKDEIIAWLTADSHDANVALNTYNVLVTPGDGLIPDMGLDKKDLRGTAELRNSFGGFDTEPNIDWMTTPASGMYDLSFWRLSRYDARSGTT